MIHLMGVVLFLGNMIVSAYWKLRSDHSRDPKIILFAYKEIIRTDYFFTIPGGFLILGGGIGMVWVLGYPFFQMPWLMGSAALLGVAAFLWGTVLAPCQRKMLRLAEEAVATGRSDPGMVRLSRIWYLTGIFGTILPLAAGFLMITQPG
ncbi:MAG TPA: DUF2269 family protein [Nitrospiria bacterium]